jgi:large subunit ribosomal protein L33
MAKDKNVRSYIKLKSSESDYCYYTQKNKRNTTDKIEIKKYDPTLRKHVIFREAKM